MDIHSDYNKFRLFNITQRIMDSLIQRAYNSFKMEFPNEEPWWRVVCMRKQYRSKYNITPEDESKTWRQIIYEDDDKKQTIKKTVQSSNPPETISRRIIKTTNKSRQIYDGSNGKIHKTQWVKKEPEFTTEIIKYEQTDLDIHANCIDVCFRKDEPVDIECVKDDVRNINTIWGISEKQVLKPININGILALDLDDLRRENERLRLSLSEITDEMTKYKNRLMEVDVDRKSELQEENEKMAVMNHECMQELKNINLNLKKNLTMKDILLKYNSIQIKLNEALIAVRRIIKKTFDSDEFDLDGKIKEFGFVMTIPRLIDYLVSVIKYDDDYVEEYE